MSIHRLFHIADISDYPVWLAKLQASRPPLLQSIANCCCNALPHYLGVDER